MMSMGMTTTRHHVITPAMKTCKKEYHQCLENVLGSKVFDLFKVVTLVCYYSVLVISDMPPRKVSINLPLKQIPAMCVRL